MDVQTDPDLDDFSNMYKSNNNYGEFIVSLNKINGSLGFSLRSDPEDTTALRLVYSGLKFSFSEKATNICATIRRMAQIFVAKAELYYVKPGHLRSFYQKFDNSINNQLNSLLIFKQL